MFRSLLCLCCAALILESCGSDNPTASEPTAFVEIFPPTVAIIIGDTAHLNAAAKSSAGDTIPGKPITWSSANTSIATVSSSGVVTGDALGTVSITARADTAASSATVYVLGRPAQLFISASGDSLFAGDSTAWSTNALDSAGQYTFPKTVTWRVADTTVVRGRPIGRDVWLKGRAPGVTWVIASAGSLRDSAQIWVRNHVKSIEISPDTGTILISSTVQLMATLRDTAGAILSGRPVQWEVVRGLAVIDSTGLMHAVGGGSAAIVARAEGITDTARFYFRISGAFTAVTAGDLHTCGLTTGGAAYCWGSDAYGQLGLGPSPSSNLLAPALVASGETYTSISAGHTHTCAVGVSAECWGHDAYGVLGNESGVGECAAGGTCRGTPLAVTGGIDFTQVSAGDMFTCGLDGSAAAYCWGNNSLGELGIGSVDDNPHPAPVAVTGGVSFQSLVAGGGHVCALSTGLAYCWGYNHQDQLGLGVVDTAGQTHATPDTVAGGHRFRELSAGTYHTCGIASDSSAFCWGTNDAGQLGQGSTSNPVNTPVPVTTALKFLALAAGFDHTCGIATDSLAYCWGANSGGQLGDGTTAPHYTPMPVSGGLKFSVITANRNFTCGVSSNVAYCWGGSGAGGGGEGRLGTDPASDTTVPGRVQGQP